MMIRYFHCKTNYETNVEKYEHCFLYTQYTLKWGYLATILAVFCANCITFKIWLSIAVKSVTLLVYDIIAKYSLVINAKNALKNNFLTKILKKQCSYGNVKNQ